MPNETAPQNPAGSSASLSKGARRGGESPPATSPQTAIRGDPEMLERLHAWAAPIFGGDMWIDGPGGLRELQRIIEDAAEMACGVPLYRKISQ